MHDDAPIPVRPRMEELLADVLLHYVEIPPVENPCGKMRELYHSEHMSITHVRVSSDTIKHMHHYMTEVHYVLTGHGKIIVGDKEYGVGAGHRVAVPPGTWHHLRATPQTPMDVLVMTSPRYNPNDILYPPVPVQALLSPPKQ